MQLIVYSKTYLRFHLKIFFSLTRVQRMRKNAIHKNVTLKASMQFKTDTFMMEDGVRFRMLLFARTL